MRVSNICLVVLIVTLAGCSPKMEKVAVFPVLGEVHYDGNPAAGVQVFLLPLTGPSLANMPANPHGTTGPDGKFSISTYTTGDGAPNGTYRLVLLWPYEKREDQPDGGEDDRLQGWYDARRTQLEVTVQGSPVTLDLISLPIVTGPPPESKGVPGRN